VLSSLKIDDIRTARKIQAYAKRIYTIFVKLGDPYEISYYLEIKATNNALLSWLQKRSLLQNLLFFSLWVHFSCYGVE